ncbi:hypothetical protein C8J57DRAFT_1281793 [Mycena rebaudengoi]|nr:hypothetical protein C8J57DRAFT_1281793 [Mycena rebaudengoi]
MSSPAKNTSSSYAGPSSSSFSLSNNLVEIGALTALVGSTVAESLVLGNRGAAGVAWAATSSFGTISVVKACFCGASSGWLRETLGIRTASCDSAVGLELPHDSKRASKLRRNIGEPLAIFRRVTEEDDLYVKGHKPVKAQVAWSDVYALDHSTSLMLRGVPDTNLGTSVQIFTYGQYTFLRNRDTRIQIPAVFLSTAKVAELYVLWTRSAALLGITSATPWLFFFFGALFIQINEMILGRRPEPALGNVDIVAGQLPMVSRRGGPRKIILGAVDNSRRYLAWRLFWTAGAMVSATSIIISYFLMGDQPSSTVFIWAGFQLLWLVVRIVVYHLTDPANPMSLRILVVRPWDTLPENLKERVLDLTFALAQCQSFIHPRGQPQYSEDVFSARDVRLLLDGISPPNLYPLHEIHPPLVSVEMKAVFGDTSLSSAMWITGSYISPMDLYDSCIVIFVVRESGAASSAPQHTIAVPAARVLSAASIMTFDSEHNMPVYVPKGVPNSGYGLRWWYWIPCSTGQWLQMQIPLEEKTLGVRQAEVRTGAQVSALLAAGNLNIGLKHVEEVREVVELSRKALVSFKELLA